MDQIAGRLHGGMEHKQQPGIPIDAGHNPLRQTVVVCFNMTDFDMFCRGCEINSRNRQMKPLTVNWHGGLKGSLYLATGQIDVVFLGMDPRYDDLGGSFYTVDELRQRNCIKKVYLYEDWFPGSIKPVLLMEEGREW